MPKSMTAFGRGENPVAEGSWVAELKTVNSRYLDLHFRIPPSLTALEDRIKKLVSSRIARGRVNLSIKANGVVEAPPSLVLNKPLVNEYKKVLTALKRELGVTEDPGLAPFLENRDIIQTQEETPDLEAVWADVKPALEKALEENTAMRQTEGRSMAQDLNQRLDTLAGLFAQVVERSPEIVENYKQRLNERVAKITEDVEFDPQRLAFEVALMADKCDITEEEVRASSHLKQFRSFLAQDEPVGRKLDFLTQELNREANTMGSKSPDADCGQLVVEIKAELERIREQIQNIE
ncbi:YicC/YloC family endoribonuclease [Dethiosulfatarculus sandiegensis]|uniref:Stationary phase survival protein n=1 Tax=Dethiosulfatarculus sandiegensis TaxID=1429043 RepID=A0A0D2JAY0_9BACT|nr:YicC/YloC family endoribonuclease [Dethiosulfatarculus sandiegensis]KIX12881.1 stationary phase survival protein [Dethiosulfatarculus sandiegensis]